MTSKQKDGFFVHSNFIIVTVGIEVVEVERRNGQPTARALSLAASGSGVFASDSVAWLENVSCLGHEETGNCRVALRLRQRKFQPTIKVPDRQSACKKVFVIAVRRNLLIYLFIVLIRNVTYNFFEQILKRNDAFESAVFIDYKTKMRLRFLHLPQNIFKPRGVDYVQWRL
jgi:hypothetical protein